jgi:PAS domain S-box-containing protein
VKIFLSESEGFSLNLFTLSFSKDLERTFQEDYFRKSLRHVRMNLLLAILVYSIFGILDAWIAPEAKLQLWFIRFAIFLPYVIAIYLFSYTRYFRRYMQLAISSVVLLAGLGIITMIIIAPYPGNYSYYAGLILVFLYGYTFFKLRFIWASMAGWLIVISYEISALFINEAPWVILVNNNFFFLTGNILGMIACYSIELYLRQNYIKTTLLEIEKKKVDEANRKLEERVEQRTQQLVTANKELRDRVEERRQAEKALQQRVEFEQLITALSTRFIHLEMPEIATGVQDTLITMGDFVGADCSYLYLFPRNGRALLNKFEWCNDTIPQGLKKLRGAKTNNLPWFINRIKKFEIIRMNKLSDLPQEAAKEKKWLESRGIKSVIRAPMIFEGDVVGFIGFDSIKQEKAWREEVVSLLKIVGDMLVITLERKKAGELLTQSEQKYRTLFEKSKDVVFISTPNGKMLDINPAGLDLFGYASKEEICNINVNKLYVNPSDRNNYERILEQQGHIKDFELVLKKKDGQHLNVLETTTAVRDQNGKILAYHGIIRDVTARRKLELQLNQAQKMESIGHLAGGIAHDFNNILTAVKGYSDLVLLNINQDNQNYRHMVGILKGVKNAENLTRQLLAFSRKQIIETKIININHIISDLDKMMRRLIGEDINLKAILSNNINHIKADLGQIEQILVNLVINARDAINQKLHNTGDKKITVETKEVYLDPHYVANHPGSSVGQFILISVSDTGIGMDEEAISKIFEPFYTTKERGKGTGLGLSTVYGIVKQNNGSIYVYSESGKGSTFKIYWPCTEEDETVEFVDDISVDLISGEETILFVEDDGDIRKFVCTALRSLNYQIFEASNGVQALKLLNKNKLGIDLLITDVVMPEMGGKELAETVKKIIPNVKIIFTSGYTDNHIVRSGRLTRGINFIQKPFSIRDIAKKIRVVMEN